MTQTEDIKVLVVEDEIIIAFELKMKLELSGYKVIGMAATADEAVELANEHQPEVVLMDINLSGEHDGIEAARRIQQHQDIAIIYMTGNAHLKADRRLLSTHPMAVLPKPCLDSKLLEAIEQAVAARVITSAQLKAG